MSHRLLSYIAGPYSCPGCPKEEEIKLKDERYQLLTIASCMLMHCKGWNCFSPITHSHPMHVYGDLRGDWSFWKRVDTEYLELSSRIVVVTLPGWEHSTGVNAEIAIANEMNLPIWHLTAPNHFNGRWTAWLTDNVAGEFLQYDIKS